MPELKHFLDLDQVEPELLRRILGKGAEYKRARANGGHGKPLAGKTLAMLFEKPSTRTRVSFEVGMRDLGGKPSCSAPPTPSSARTIADTARVLSRYVDMIMIRTTSSEAARHGPRTRRCR